LFRRKEIAMEEIILRANGSVTKKPPLLAGFGFVVERGGQIVERGAGIVVTDRPTAYTAILGSVVAGLETLGELMPYICPPPRVVVAMSHWVVCEQVTRRRAHEPEHQVLVERAGMLIDGLKAAGCPVDLVKVSREKGLAALKLARQAIEVESHSEAPARIRRRRRE
jgi:hypothetical protein